MLRELVARGRAFLTEHAMMLEWLRELARLRGGRECSTPREQALWRAIRAFLAEKEAAK